MLGANFVMSQVSVQKFGTGNFVCAIELAFRKSGGKFTCLLFTGCCQKCDKAVACMCIVCKIIPCKLFKIPITKSWHCSRQIHANQDTQLKIQKNHYLRLWPNHFEFIDRD